MVLARAVPYSGHQMLIMITRCGRVHMYVVCAPGPSGASKSLTPTCQCILGTGSEVEMGGSAVTGPDEDPSFTSDLGRGQNFDTTTWQLHGRAPSCCFFDLTKRQVEWGRNLQLPQNCDLYTLVQCADAVVGHLTELVRLEEPSRVRGLWALRSPSRRATNISMYVACRRACGRAMTSPRKT